MSLVLERGLDALIAGNSYPGVLANMDHDHYSRQTARTQQTHFSLVSQPPMAFFVAMPTYRPLQQERCIFKL